MINITNKNYESIISMMKLVKEKLFNKEQLDYILSNLYDAQRNIKNVRITASENKITITDKKSTDSFSVEVNDDEIATSLTCWNGHHHERRVIKYVENIVAVKTEESTSVVMASTQEPSSTSRKHTIEIYKNNEILCKKEFSSETQASLDSLLSSTTVSETFINSDKQAVEKITSASDDEAFNKTGVQYLYSSAYDAPPFNDMNASQTVYMYGMKEITEQEYNDFMSKLKTNNEVTLSKIFNKKSSK